MTSYLSLTFRRKLVNQTFFSLLSGRSRSEENDLTKGFVLDGKRLWSAVFHKNHIKQRGMWAISDDAYGSNNIQHCSSTILLLIACNFRRYWNSKKDLKECWNLSVFTPLNYFVRHKTREMLRHTYFGPLHFNFYFSINIVIDIFMWFSG